MRISDWSSDVCSSDLVVLDRSQPRSGQRRGEQVVGARGAGSLQQSGERGECDGQKGCQHGKRGDQFDQGKARFLAVHVWLLDEGISGCPCPFAREIRSEEHTSELQSLMRLSYAVFCLKNK